MSTQEKEPSPPPYSESTAQQSPYSSLATSSTSTSHPPPSSNLLTQLSSVRATHLHTIITSHILPLIEQQATYGISETNIALLPSDVSLPIHTAPEKSEFSFDTTDDATEKKLEIIGFSSDEEPKLIRLEGSMNKTEFWRVPAVVEDMEERLRACLNAAAAQAVTASSSQQQQQVSSSAPRGVTKRGFLGKLANFIEQEKRSSPFVGKEAERGMGQVVVRVRLEEICLRTVNEFGLYDTLSKPCVTVWVDARC
ncbi:unnamed protein product [Periconia digitata]|uniref:Uncharacterized protein n=1 Tax=Periconia digitata TaxID=1303443 RepID=A0A9W4UFI3_9PLEO|nr:unnamed protein product [Periconia digitata]